MTTTTAEEASLTLSSVPALARRLVGAAALVLAAGAIGLPASAATLPARPPQGVAAPQNGGVAQRPAGDDVYRTWYTSHSKCVAAGQGGIDRGHWEHYTCSEGDWFWHLWTNR
ncbi:hypothetical protein AAH991_08635 [Microbispora sp. ZYX-F-249]|uniref:Chitinase n=1 Tax=Microbispora maris TaxID=3144104 RepID=A0ABV0AIK8_9ACTN